MTDDPEASNGWDMITIEELTAENVALRAELAKAGEEIAELRAVAGAARPSQQREWHGEKGGLAAEGEV